MRLLLSAAAALVLMVAGAQAQWVSFVSKEDRFAVWFPAQPSVAESQWTDEDGKARRARTYTAERAGNTYKVIAVDFSDARYSTLRGSMAHAATQYRQLGKVTYDAYAQIDRIEGHQLQITQENGRRVFFAAHLHDGILYILDANISARSAPPIQFQQALQILDKDGARVRYTEKGERIKRTDDLAEGLGGPDLNGPILSGTSDVFIP